MKTIEELEARIAELESAVEWVLSSSEKAKKEIPEFAVQTAYFVKELRARAFPPKFEEVELTTTLCPKCLRHLEPHIECAACRIKPIVFSAYYQRPIVAKVKRREEIEIDRNGNIKYLHTEDRDSGIARKFFAEWEK